jgi:hypothetical protein
MAFCSKITPNIITNFTQASQPYANSVLPAYATMSRIQDGNNKGRLTNQSLETIYNNLKSAGKLVDQKPNLNDLGNKDKTKERNNEENYSRLSSVGTTELNTMKRIAEEYCFYYIRYKYVLEVLFEKLMSASSQAETSAQTRQDINQHLEQAKSINMKLNDIIQITNFLAKKRGEEMKGQNTEINMLNDSITSNFDALKKHDNMLKQETSLADLRKSMVEYSQEKNLSAQNLLALYGFLNLVALGLLFYIART